MTAELIGKNPIRVQDSMFELHIDAALGDKYGYDRTGAGAVTIQTSGFVSLENLLVLDKNYTGW